MKNTLFLLFTILLFFSCSGNAQKTEQDISQIPMYGHIKKSKELQESDREFIEHNKKNKEESLNQISFGLVDEGWYYLHQDDLKTAIRRFNQAWLLDSTNVVIYASFATYLAIKGEEEETKKMIDKTMEIGSNDAQYLDMLTSFGIVVYRKTENPLFRDYMLHKLETSSINASDKERLINQVKAYKDPAGNLIK